MNDYSVDLRQRIVDTYITGEGSQWEIAKRFCVSLSTVKNYLKLYEQTGSLLPKEHAGGRQSVVNSEQLTLVKTILERESDITLTELCVSFEEKTGIRVATTSMWRAVNKLNWTRKKRLYMLQSKSVKMLRKSEESL